MDVFWTSLAILLVTSGAHTIPKQEETKDNVHFKDNRHFQSLEEHNAQYDHEAFLGSDAKSFDELSPEESRYRLGAIVDKIDKDKDGFVTREELKDWIDYTKKKYISDNVDRQWKAHNPEGKDKITWAEYKKIMYSFLEDVNENELEKDSEGFSYVNLLRRDRRRWSVADEEGDDALTKHEFAAFLHPDEIPHMRDILVLETMEDIDKDGDRKINLDEYIGDQYKGEPNDIEPDWVKSEREQFKTFRDKDGDGFMNLEEVKNWIIPPDFDQADAEAHHLIHDSDTDKDGKLTKDEILGNYDLFVGSQATDFGEALARHDEF